VHGGCETIIPRQYRELHWTDGAAYSRSVGRRECMRNGAPLQDASRQRNATLRYATQRNATARKQAASDAQHRLTSSLQRPNDDKSPRTGARPCILRDVLVRTSGLIYKTSSDEPTKMLRRNQTYKNFTKNARKSYEKRTAAY